MSGYNKVIFRLNRFSDRKKIFIFTQKLFKKYQKADACHKEELASVRAELMAETASLKSEMAEKNAHVSQLGAELQKYVADNEHLKKSRDAMANILRAKESECEVSLKVIF